MKKTILYPDIHGHRELFLRVHRFNLLPTRYIHTSWLQELAGDFHGEICHIWKNNSRAEKHCAALIIKTFCRGFIYDFSDTFRRVALLPAQELARLMVYTGLAVHSYSITRSIAGRQAQTLSRAFGPEAYEFATTRAILLVGPQRFDFLMPRQAGVDAHPEVILESGRRCLQISLEGAPDPLVQRLRLKLPRSMCWDFKRCRGDAVRSACRRLIQKIIKMEVRPQWNMSLH